MRFCLEKVNEKIFSENTAAALLVISFMLLLTFTISFMCNISWSTENLGSLTGGVVMCVISVANAILLYSTLKLQGKGITNEKDAHRQQQFETTFFNLLEFQRRLTEEIVVKYKYVDDRGYDTMNEAKGKEFFHFAKSELQLISMTLKSNIKEKYDEEQPMSEITELENEKNAPYPIELEKQRYEKMEGIREKLRIKLCNRVYDIDDKARQRCSFDSKESYLLFSKIWDNYYERYITNIFYILQYVSEGYYLNEKEKQKYINFIRLQMSKDELYFVETHAQSFPPFRDLLEKTHLTELLPTNRT